MTDFEAFVKSLEDAGIKILDPEELRKAFDVYVRELADEVLFEAVDRLNRDGTSDQGTLANSGVVLERPEGGVDLLFAAEHASWIEFGTGPHPVSAEGEQAIREWVARKLRPVPAPGQSADEKIAQVARAIVWDIRQNGQDPKPYLYPALETVLARSGESR